jgi:hypothetical protein
MASLALEIALSSSKNPEDPKPDDGSGWFEKRQSDLHLGHHGPSKLTPAEQRAMDAEARWAGYAKSKDVPGPTRIKVYVTRRNIVKRPGGAKPEEDSSG